MYPFYCPFMYRMAPEVSLPYSTEEEDATPGQFSPEAAKHRLWRGEAASQEQQTPPVTEEAPVPPFGAPYQPPMGGMEQPQAGMPFMPAMGVDEVLRMIETQYPNIIRTLTVHGMSERNARNFVRGIIEITLMHQMMPRE